MLSVEQSYSHYASRYDKEARILSFVLHALVFLFIVAWTFLRPYEPQEISFDEIEVIDVETFEELLEIEEQEPGSEGEDVADAPTSAPAALDGEVAQSQDEETTQAPVTTQSAPTPAVEPENLPEPIFQPPQAEVAQNLPQAEEADPGLAEAESTGQENANVLSQVEAPPPRNAEQIRQIARESEGEISQQPREELVDAPSESVAQEEDAQSESLADATSEILEDIQNKDELAGAAQTAQTPQTREEEAPAPPAEEEVAEAAPDPIEQAIAEAALPEAAAAPPVVEAPEIEAPAEPAPAAEPVVENSANGTEEANNVESLLDTVLEAEDGTQKAGRGLSNGERASLLARMNDNFSRLLVAERGRYRPQPVQVTFKTNASGNLVGDVQLASPQNPTQDQFMTFSAARRAVLFSMPLRMPPDIDPEGLLWRVTFDPSPSGGAVY